MSKTKEVLTNPAFLFGVGLLPLIAVCTDFKSAVIYACLMFLTMTLSQLLVGAFRLVIAKRVRFICYTLAVMAVVYVLDSALCELFFKSYSSLHSLVVFLLAGSVVFYSLEEANQKEDSGKGFKFVLITASEYSVSMIIVGLIREVLGSGSVWGNSISANFTGISFFKTFAGGLMVILVMALIYLIIANILKRRAEKYGHLVARYGAVIKQNLPQTETKETASTEENSSNGGTEV